MQFPWYGTGRRLWIAVAGVLVGVAGAAQAQIPDKYENLKILPAAIQKRELVQIMRGFASALGVRCLHCHVGKSPDDLSGYDFASDEKEHKKVARAMMEMTREINEKLLPKTGRTKLLEVGCATCHRGVEKPEPVQDIVLRDLKSEGIEVALKRYRELRDKHGRDGAYDFSARPLNKLGEVLAAEKDLSSAVAVMRLAVELDPDAAHSHSLLGTLLAQSGDRSGAIAALEKAVALEPDAGWYKEQLEKLKAEPAGKP